MIYSMKVFFHGLKILFILCNFLFVAVDILSVKAMAAEYQFLGPYWLSDCIVNFSMHLFNLFSNNFSIIFENYD